MKTLRFTRLEQLPWHTHTEQGSYLSVNGLRSLAGVTFVFVCLLVAMTKHIRPGNE